MKNYILKNVEQFPTYQLVTLEPEDERSERLDYWPGQYATISFKSGKSISPMRCFSMVSSPNQTDLQFAMRRDGKFTKKLGTLDPGTAVKVHGPFGNFVIDTADTNVILLAAGIGITPYMSMLRHAVESRLATPITLIYACRNIDDIPFRDELVKLSSQKQNLRIIFVLNEGVNDPTNNIYIGRVDESLLSKVTGQKWQSFTYFICGPLGFSRAMMKTLKAHDIGEDSIITEAFTQTTSLSWKIWNRTIESMTYVFTTATLVAGVALIMIIDLARYVPRTVQALNPATTVPTTIRYEANTESDQTDTTSGVTPNNTNTPTTTVATQPTQVQYQQPICRTSRC